MKGKVGVIERHIITKRKKRLYCEFDLLSVDVAFYFLIDVLNKCAVGCMLWKLSLFLKISFF